MLTDHRKKITAFICAAVSVMLLCSCTPTQSQIEDDTAEAAITARTSAEAESSPAGSVDSENSAPAGSADSESSAPDTQPSVPTEDTPQEAPVDAGSPDAAEPLLTEEPAAVSDGHVTLGAAELSGYSVGRTLLKDDVLYMNHTCSGIRFDFRGTSLKAEFVSSPEYCHDDVHKAWIAVYLENSTDPYARFPLDSEQAEYTLIESDELIEATVTVVKLTEEQFGTAGIRSLTAGAQDVIRRIPDSDRYIEFFGDSITAGYGNEGELSHGFDTSEENGYLTYAPITARALGADYSMVCVSGMGLTASRTCDFVAGDIYTRTDAFISDEEYSFGRQPQLIVVNLGANDSYYINKDSSYYDLYETRYYDLLKEIRSKNPDSAILCCICDYWKERMPQIERVIGQFTSDTGDDKIYSLLLPYVRENEDYGSDAHPKIKVHYDITDVLFDKIKELGIF